MKIWDGFIRIYHWSQVVVLGSLWYTAEEGLMELHFTLAYLLMALLLTRILWGFIGSDTARFSHFLGSPQSVINYLKTSHTNGLHHSKGHNPAGGYMVLALLLLLLVQLVTGLFSNDDILSEGPLAYLVSYDTSGFLTRIHHLNFDLILGFTAVHVIAVILYRLKGVNLILPMFTGKVDLDETEPKMKHPFKAWSIFAVISVFIYFIWADEVISYLF
ncbi:cytochrome b/b6 domain-containing protein [Aliivibrio fischeri]|uniref:cytochrome b/b6 domain-containing protein n=1 Tax=Aliivibrio fischeri TaxID=668 RepID=UPI001322B1F4|nr:hydrogenase [Aliivibrio fischeri]